MTNQHPTKSSPPRWDENLLRLLLRDCDRDTVAGDLLEEYQEAILPIRGRLRASVWYSQQTLSFVNSLTLGIVLGAVFGAWNLMHTLLAPLADDTVAAVLSFYGPMFVMWGFAGFVACRFVDAIKSGVIVGAIMIAVLHIVVILRVNIFLDILSQRADWRGLSRAFRSSGFESFRAYANYSYAQQTIPELVAAIMIGTITGALGGLACKLSRGSQTIG